MLTGLLACAAASLMAVPAPAAATGVSSISVDVGPLRARGLGDYADTVGAVLQSEIRAAFADAMSRDGPRLVVRVDAISMRAYVGSETRFGSGGTSNDYLEGEAILLGRRGEVVRRHPQLSALPASSGGAWYLPDNEQRRMKALAQHFAGWLRRGLE